MDSGAGTKAGGCKTRRRIILIPLADSMAQLKHFYNNPGRAAAPARTDALAAADARVRPFGRRISGANMEDNIELAARVGAALQARGIMLATAESCTGGGVAQAITEIAGSSNWFDRGFVTYSNAAKTAMLGVPDALIAQHGAVSEEVARAMAQGAVDNSAADAACSTTGIAGPGGAVPGKPVGTVCFGWSLGGKTLSERLVFAGDRHAVREQSIAHALRGLLQLIEGS
jgi:nicotinamide-nucleotide amidase